MTTEDILQPILSTKYDGKPRWLWPRVCEVCQTTFYAPKNQLRKRNTCSITCRGLLSRRREVVTCSMCETPFERTPYKLHLPKSGLKFCSRPCKDKAQRLEGFSALHPSHYGTADVSKKQLIRIRGHQCENCGSKEWMGLPIPLEVDHIDGNATNNDSKNHRLLCPNCHAQTPTYRGRNRGKGRKSLKGL